MYFYFYNFQTPNLLELHYWFRDDAHTMDALVQNKCEYELLRLIKEISSILNVPIEIDTEPFGEGGLRRWYKVISKAEKKNA